MERERTGYEATICVMEGDISENYQFHIHRPLEHHHPAQSI